MMLLSLLLLVSDPIDRADRANEDLTKCLFATARAAHSQQQSLDQFRATLATSCLAEEQSARAAAVSILMDRGESQASAESKINETLRYGRSAVIRAYSFQPPQ